MIGYFRFPWAKVYRSLSEKYGWSFEDIDKMTMYRVLVAYGAQCPEDGPKTRQVTQ